MSEIKSDKLTPVTATTTTFGDSGDKLLFATGTNLDMNGTELILDADADTSITADTDDQIDIKIAGADDFQFTANTFTAQSGSTIAAQALTATTISATSTVDINGQELILDADADTSITADTDDQIDIKIAGADDFRFTANNFNILSGSTMTIDSGATVTNSGTATGFGGGKIGQVLQTVKTDRTSIALSATNSFTTMTGISQAITPVATSSKVLIQVYFTWRLHSGNGTMHFGLFRDSTQVGMGVDSGGTSRCPDTVSYRSVGGINSGDQTWGHAWYNYGISSEAFQFLDSPSTTSAVTYSLRMSIGATYTGTVIINGTDTTTGNAGSLDYQAVSSSGITCSEVLA